MPEGGRRSSEPRLFSGRGRELRAAGLILATFLGGAVAVESAAPFAQRPALERAVPEPLPGPVAPEMPATTTTQPEIVEKREVAPGQYLGTLTLNVSGVGPGGELPMQNVVSVPLYTESKSLEEIANSGGSTSDDDPLLLRGAILHIDTPLPGSFTKAEASASHYKPVIAAHRLTSVNGMPHGPFYDIDKLQAGDSLTISYDNGKNFSYKTVYSGYAPAGEELFAELFQPTNKDFLAIYACADANGQTGNGVSYDPSHRYYAIFERTS